ncbi:MAG: hypothetical protein J5I92_12590, partial [Thiogranum sp.]|nr:hypothetical protein [Thiogranum sp.]
MQYRNQVFAAALGVTVLVSNATAQEVFVYPNKGQSAEQTDQDKYACYQWASQIKKKKAKRRRNKTDHEKNRQRTLTHNVESTR